MKRFIKDDVYKNPRFKKLKPELQAGYFYYWCQADKAGFFYFDDSFFNLTKSDLAKVGFLNVNEDLFWIPNFITITQSNKLSTKQRAHGSTISAIRYHLRDPEFNNFSEKNILKSLMTLYSIDDAVIRACQDLFLLYSFLLDSNLLYSILPETECVNGQSGQSAKGHKTTDLFGVLNLYADILPEHPKAKMLGGVHLKNLQESNKLLEQSKIKWDEYFEKVKAFPFLCGDSDRGWKASLVWLINPDNLVKVINNHYDESQNNQLSEDYWDFVFERGKHAKGTT